MKKRIILIVLFALLPISCKALDCNYSEQARLRKLASNVTASYEYVEQNDTVTYNVILTNVTSELYVYDSLKDTNYYNNGTNEIVLYGYGPGTNIKYMVYPTKGNCTYSYLSVKYVNLPYYNKYYKDPLCQGKSYNICGKWQKVSLSYEEFVKTINEYDKGKKEEAIENATTVDNSIFDYISSFIFKYYLYIILVVLVGFLLYETFKKKKHGFDF